MTDELRALLREDEREIDAQKQIADDYQGDHPGLRLAAIQYARDTELLLLRLASERKKMQDRWMPCSERMPEDSQEVLWYGPSLGCGCDQHHYELGLPPANGKIPSLYTHWMPMEPPAKTQPLPIPPVAERE